MKEDFLHFIWKYQKFSKIDLQSTDQESVQVIKTGIHNIESDGPDFFTAQIVINEQLWAGNVEIHIKSSDWYAHQHQNDEVYDSVILHVVWEDDVSVFRKDNTKIPTLELRQFISIKVKKKYDTLFNKQHKKWINCENDIESVSDFVWNNWLEKLYIERLEDKSILVCQLLKENNNNWEAACFCMLAKAFGGNINGEVFLEMAKSIPFTIIQKETSVFRLEALFFGQLNMLNIGSEGYELVLFKEYSYLKKKFLLTPVVTGKVQFYRLRPNNFPTIRLSQLANLYAININFFTQFTSDINYKKYHSILTTKASEYWDTHFNFGKESKIVKKRLSTSFKDVLLINTVVPLAFVYSKLHYKDSTAIEQLLYLVRNIPSEKNTIITNFKAKGKISKNALESQAMINLFKQYCSKYRCLQCRTFHFIINQS